MASSRRGAVRVNPVTGKIEKLDPATQNMEGKHRDGCMMIDDRYINAAKELGLGGEDGMYSHLKALKRMGAADIPHGASIETESSGAGASTGKVDAKNFASVAAAMAKDVSTTQKGTGQARIAGFGASGVGGITKSANTDAAMATTAKGVGRAQVHGFSGGGGATGGTAAAMPTASKGVGAGNVHGFGGEKKATLTSTFHNHQDSFQRRKGVVNTIGGAKDVTRVEKSAPAALPKKGESKGAQIMGLDMLDQHTNEGKARRAAAEKRMAAGNGPKTDAVHVSGGGGRPKPADIFKAKMAKMESAAPVRRVTMQPTVNVLDENSGSGSSSASTKLAGAGASGSTSSAGGGGGAGAGDMRAARAAHFEKMFAEQEAKKKAAAVAAGLA